jgi:hypothetical protein
MTDIDASALHVTDAKEPIVPTSADSLVAEVLSDPACSYWLRDRIREALARDPLDALRDAETLVAILEARWLQLAPASRESDVRQSQPCEPGADSEVL